jgi:hypothetical protein
MPFTGVSSAPAGTNEMLQHYTRFAAASEGLVMNTCLPICNVSFTPTVDETGGSFRFRDWVDPTVTKFCSTASIGLQGVVAPMIDTSFSYSLGVESSLQYISPVFKNLSANFVRYRVRRLMFHYTPQSTTTVNGRAVFAFADDPVHPIIVPGLESSSSSTPSGVMLGGVPSQESLLALGDSMAFAPWLPWSLDVSDRVKQNELYIDGGFGWQPAGTAPTPVEPYLVTSVSGFTAALRQWGFGSIGIATSTTESTAFEAGVLWMELEVELIEFCPIVSGSGGPGYGPGPLSKDVTLKGSLIESVLRKKVEKLRKKNARLQISLDTICKTKPSFTAFPSYERTVPLALGREVEKKEDLELAASSDEEDNVVLDPNQSVLQMGESTFEQKIMELRKKYQHLHELLEIDRPACEQDKT